MLLFYIAIDVACCHFCLQNRSFFHNKTVADDDGTIDADEFIEVPCYWKNEAYNVLPITSPDNNGRAQTIQVSGTTIYAAGYTLIPVDEDGDDSIDGYYKEPCYWQNRTYVSLQGLNQEPPPGSPLDELGVYDIQVINNTIYMAGSSPDDLGLFEPCQWINHNVISTLPLPDLPFVSGGAYAIQIVEE